MKEAEFSFLHNNSILMIGNLDRERKNFSFISPAVKMLNELPEVALSLKCHITFYTITQEDIIFGVGWSRHSSYTLFLVKISRMMKTYYQISAHNFVRLIISVLEVQNDIMLFRTI